MEGRVRAVQARVGLVLKLQRRHARDLDPSERVPGDVFDSRAEATSVRRCEHRSGRVIHGKSAVGKQRHGRDGNRCHRCQEARRPTGRPREHEDRANGRQHAHGSKRRSDQVEEVDSPCREGWCREQGADDEATAAEGQREQNRYRDPLKQRQHELRAERRSGHAEVGLVQEYCHGEEAEDEQARADRQRIIEMGQEELEPPAQENARNGEAEHGQRDDQERIVVQQLGRHHAVSEDLDEESGERSDEGHCRLLPARR